MAKRRLLFIGDAAVNTGFARAAHEYIRGLSENYDVTVLALGYVGDHYGGKPLPCKIYSAGAGGDVLGLARVGEMISKHKPQVVVIQNDPWNFPHYLSRTGTLPVVGIVAVDGLNCAGAKMNGLQGAIFWTEFGRQQAIKGGYTGHSDVVPLGVDLETYQPVDRDSQRAQWALDKVLAQNGLPPDTFIVGYVGRNQHRKRLDLLVEYFKEWMQGYDRKDVALWIQRAPTGDAAFDLAQLASYYGIGNHLLLPGVAVDNVGLSDALLSQVYGVFDIMATTTQGEGWGLPQMEGMACGIPQVVPNFSALGEWAADAAVMVPCTSHAATPYGPNTIGGIADPRLFTAALERLYKDTAHRAAVREAGLQLVRRDEYRLDNVGKAMAAAVERAMLAPGPKKPQAVTA